MSFMSYTKKIGVATLIGAMLITGCSKSNDKKSEATETTQSTVSDASTTTTVATDASAVTTIPTTGVTTPSFLLKGKSFKDAVDHLSSRERPFYCASVEKSLYKTDAGVFAAWGNGKSGVQTWITESAVAARKWTKSGDKYTYDKWVTTANPRNETIDSLPRTLAEAMTWAGWAASGAGEVTTGDDVMADYPFVVGEEKYVATVALSGGGDAGLIGIGVGGFSIACEVQAFASEGPKTLVPVTGSSESSFPKVDEIKSATSVSDAEWNVLVG